MTKYNDNTNEDERLLAERDLNEELRNMARVIEKNVKKVEKKIIHKACGAKIGYYQNEVKSYTYHDYGGGSDQVYYIVCPNCGENIEVGRY